MEKERKEYILEWHEETKKLLEKNPKLIII